jgi:mannose-6-phosphate isomerase-like protein (cupin superfamily)
MRKTSFGEMSLLKIEYPLSSDCEVMHFEKEGRDHSHKRIEVAIAVSGSGLVVIEGEEIPIKAGEFIYIPSGRKHHMVPDEGVKLCMLITYEGDG